MTPRGITGAPLPGYVWHALMVRPMQEKFACAQLKAAGVRAIYPRRVTQRRCERTGKMLERKSPQVPRIILARFSAAPNWDVMRDRRLITGVFQSNLRPIALPRDVVLSFMEIKKRAERLKEARDALFAVLVGEPATIKEGPLAGFSVNVTAIRDGVVSWESAGGFVSKGQSRIDQLERVLTDSERVRLATLDG